MIDKISHGQEDCRSRRCQVGNDFRDTTNASNSEAEVKVGQRVHVDAESFSVES
jgi:hypothetical protein